jgi:hypothetical protein
MRRWLLLAGLLACAGAAHYGGRFSHFEFEYWLRFEIERLLRMAGVT